MNNYKYSLKTHVPALPNPHFEPIIELTSNREALIEGCQGIVEYNDCIATINCKSMIITFEGFDISLKNLAGDVFSVTGNFTGISFTKV